MSIARETLKRFLNDDPVPARPLTAPEERELFREGLLGIACRQLQLKEAFLEGAAREFRWRELRAELDQTLAEQGRHAIIFKGGAALGRLYPGSGLRPVSDLDPILTSLKFTPVEGQNWIWRRGQYQLDIHDHPLSRHRYAFPWDLRRAVQQSEPISERAGLFRFQVEDETLISLIHAGKHAYSRMIWLADIHFLLQRCRPERLREILHEARAHKYLGYARWLLARINGTAAPRPGILEERLLHLCLQRATSESLGMLLPLLSISSPQQALHYMWHCLRPQNGADWNTRAREFWHLARLFRRSSTPPTNQP